MYYLFGDIIFERQTSNADGRALERQRDRMASDLAAAAAQRGLVPVAHWDYAAGMVPYDYMERIDGTHPKQYRTRYALKFCYGHESHAVIEQAHADLKTFLEGSRWADGVAGTASD